MIEGWCTSHQLQNKGSRGGEENSLPQSSGGTGLDTLGQVCHLIAREWSNSLWALGVEMVDIVEGRQPQ